MCGRVGFEWKDGYAYGVGADHVICKVGGHVRGHDGGGYTAVLGKRDT